MSSSIQIPRRRRKLTNLERDQTASGASGFSPETPDRFSAGSYGSEKGEGEVGTPTAASRPARRLSLLSTSIARAEHTVVNIGSPEAPRLITCVKASQGFDWNQEIFLPSYIDHDSEDLEHRQQPVREIILTDEEAAALLPQ